MVFVGERGLARFWYNMNNTDAFKDAPLPFTAGEFATKIDRVMVCK